MQITLIDGLCSPDTCNYWKPRRHSRSPIRQAMPTSYRGHCDITLVGMNKRFTLNKHIERPLKNEPKLVKTLMKMSKVSWRRCGHGRTADDAKAGMVVFNKAACRCTGRD